MAYPPQVPPSTRTDSTVSASTHASDHNQLARALADLIAELGAQPRGGWGDLTTRLDDLTALAGQVEGRLSEAELRNIFATVGEVPPVYQLAITSTLLTNGLIADLASTTGYVYAILDQDGRLAFGIKPDGHVVAKYELAAGIVDRAAIDPAINLPEVIKAPDSTGYAYAIVDTDGRVALGIRPDGTVAGKFDLTEAVGVPAPMTSGDYAFVLVDAEGRVSELAVGVDGRLVGPFAERIKADAADAAATATTAAAPITFWGDSLTAAGWNTTVASELGVTTKHYGIGGQGSHSIAARQGGTPALVTLPGDELPASGPVTLTNISVVVYSSSAGTGTSSGTGTIAGIHGTLTRDNTNNVHTFTRTTPGTPVWVPAGTPFVSDEAVATRNRMTVIWSGRNSFKTSTPDELVKLVRSMVDRLTSPERRFLVLEIPPWVGEESTPTPGTTRQQLDAANAALKAAFPLEFVPVAQYLRGPALADLGITPTAEDQQNITDGLTPASLRADAGHLNSNGNLALGKYVAKVITQKGWLA